MRRSLIVGALATAGLTLVASAAVAVGTIDGASAGPSPTQTGGQTPYANMMGARGSGLGSGGMMGSQGQDQGSGSGTMMGNQGQGQVWGMMGGSGASMMGGSGTSMMGSSGASMMGSATRFWLPGNGVAVTGIAGARARAAAAAKPAGLHPGEVIWFDNGFYVELKDGAGKPATEVIVNPRSGAVSPEPGPAMMWNTRFGMMRASGTGGTGGPVDSTKARSIATTWLATNRPGTTIRGIDAYPGYFTIDLQRNGVLSGMMSISSSTGAVWYHTWHGAFISREDS